MTEFRKARRVDLPSIVALLATMDGEVPLPLDHAVRVFREMTRYRSYACYLAIENGEAVGTFALLVFPTLVHQGAFEAVVDGVVVAPRHRGRGVGGAMMTEAMRLASAAGCYKLSLSSNAKRKAAHAFYESLGFRRHGVSFWVNVVPTAEPFEAMNDGFVPMPD